MRNVIFVCTGNICRSPMSEGILRARWRALCRNDLHVSSTGIHAQDDRPPSENSLAVCQENGIDISRHLSHALNPRDINAADYVFCMELVQRDYLLLFFPQLADRTFLLGSWPNPDRNKDNVPDPIGGSLNDYRKTFQLISRHIDRIVPVLGDEFTDRI